MQNGCCNFFGCAFRYGPARSGAKGLRFGVSFARIVLRNVVRSVVMTLLVPIIVRFAGLDTLHIRIIL